ncbi:MAG: methionyl-tRNA formyltransferase [Lachnospiraceae bacterium]|nr:methionyl-tRNA formyltransferase [Lachnospiraceae bacterium]
MRAVFMGTPEIAATVLKSVLASKHEVVAVVTQTDKPKGRGHEMAFPPVKEVALDAGIPVLQPQRARDEEFIEQLKAYQPDIILVAAYGKLLPKAILDMPRFGCINVHASLLPKYRGASPIQWAVLNGDEKSGVTIMHMAETMDTGDIIMTKEVVLDKEETAGSLHDKLAEIGGPLLIEAMDALETGRAPRIRQDEEEATYVKMLDKTMGNLDFSKPAVQLERWIRGLNPWPTAYTKLDGKMLKLWKAEVLSVEEAGKSSKGLDTGAIIAVSKDSFDVLTGDGVLRIKELQLEGKRKMTAEEFLRGFTLEAGTLLGRY